MLTAPKQALINEGVTQRTGSPVSVSGGSVVKPPAIGGGHNDYTEWSGPQRVRDLAKPPGDPKRPDYQLLGGKSLLDPEEVPELLQHRFVYINVWRNISDVPIQKRGPDGPSATARRGAPPSSFVETANIYKGREGEIYSFQHDPSHRWIYFSQMRKDEAILLKCYDSRKDVARWTGRPCSVTRLSPDRTGEPRAPPRES